MHGAPKIELIEEWVSRADLVALSLWFSSWEVPAAVLHLISRHSAKWTTLEFHYPFQWGMPGRATSVPTPAPSFSILKKLVVASHPRTDEYLHQSDALGSAPQLCEVRFEGTPQIFNLPWAQLTKLTCAHPIGVTDMLRVLSLTPNLVHFGVASIPVGMERTTAQPLLRLIHLETLIFHHGRHDRTQSVALLGKIALPALLKLDVATLNPFEVPLLNSFLSRASYKLVEFAVNTQATPMASLIPCLQIIPNLNSLHLTVFPSDGAVAFLERLGTDTTYLPKLQHLTVGRIGSGPTSPLHSALD
ncbi:hypothetical protein C8J57DRAFT_1497986 [Mycena rebaudengoi]|nr:hypothetical protein C8J57DRAFT_1497986 [Mycena rebaudengoi]